MVEIDFDNDLDFGGSIILGSGRFGEVKTAKWNGLVVAVKHFRAHGDHNIDAIRTEVGARASLHSDYVVPLYAASTVAPNFCMVMEYASEGSLRQYLDSAGGALAHALQASFLFDIARGMLFLHKKGILHRDLKSAKVLVFSNGRLKLSDFGLSKIEAESANRSRAGGPLRTLQWTSPEEMDGGRASVLTDVYSFGVVCYEVATRMVPFHGMQLVQVMMAVLNKERPAVPEGASASPDIVPLIERCWKQDPAQRPEGFAPLVEELARVVKRVGDPRHRSSDVHPVDSPPGAKIGKASVAEEEAKLLKGFKEMEGFGPQRVYLPDDEVARPRIRQEQALNTPVGRWLQMEAHFDVTQAFRFSVKLDELGFRNIRALGAQDEEEHKELALNLNMSRYEKRVFLNAMKALRSKSERQRLAAEEEAKRQRLLEEEAERQRLAAEEEAERQRLAAEEAERQRLAEEEAERQRLAAEEAERQRLAEEEEAERQRLAAEEAERQRLAEEEEKKAKRQRWLEKEAEQQILQVHALHTPVGKWLRMEAHFDDIQAFRFWVKLDELGLRSTRALEAQNDADLHDLADDLKMSRYEKNMFLNAMKALRSKSGVSDVPSSTSGVGASYVHRMQMHDCGGMATVFTANERIGGPGSTETRRVVLKRSDTDHSAAFQRESLILQYLGGRQTAGFVIKLIETFNTHEHNFIVMEEAGENLSVLVRESKRYSSIPEQKTQLALWGQQACQVLVALHDLGIVWGDVKPENFVRRRDRLVAVDFGSTCVEDKSEAQQQLGMKADTCFTSNPSDQFAWSVQYAAPERARKERLRQTCVARPSQDVWSLGMVLYFLSRGGKPYFPSPEDGTDVTINKFREQTHQALCEWCEDDFLVKLERVPGSAWRCSLKLALITSDVERGTASEVLEALSRGIQGLTSAISKSRGMEAFQRKLDAIQEEVRKSAGVISDNVELVRQEQLILRRRVVSMSNVLEHLAMDEDRMPHFFLVLPDKKSRLPKPKKWFANTGRLHFVCAQGLELVPCGKDGAGFLVSQPKEWVKKHATLLQVTVMAIVAAAAVAGAAAAAGAMGPIASWPFEIIELDKAYEFLLDAKGEMDCMLDDISDTLDPAKGEMGVPNLQRVKDVTGAEYRKVLHFLDTKCQGWDRQMGGLERTISADGVVGWICPKHRSEWISSDIKGSRATVAPATGQHL